jgi:hypothetical protein
VSVPYEQGGRYRVNVRFEHRFVPHISAAELQRDPVLKDFEIFTVGVGSNFLLEPEEVEAILRHIPAGQRPG